MPYVLEILNKIKWDKRENPSDYSIIYFDRIQGKTKQIKYTQIKQIQQPFILVITNNQEVNIPLHRIIQIKKKDKIVWKR